MSIKAKNLLTNTCVLATVCAWVMAIGTQDPLWMVGAAMSTYGVLGSAML